MKRCEHDICDNNVYVVLIRNRDEFNSIKYIFNCAKDAFMEYAKLRFQMHDLGGEVDIQEWELR